MAETKTAVANVPIWLALSSGDPAGSREFYGKLFGWHVEVNPDPQYGGYALGKLGGKDVAGIGPKQSPEGPSAWLVYVGTKNADDTVKKTKAAGGRVIVEPMQVGPQGRMVVIQDPAGAFIGAWEPGEMKGAQVMNVPNSFSWSELNARGIDKSIDFYNKVFGWSPKKSEMGGQGDMPEYIEFQVNGDSIAGGMEMNPTVPADVLPSAQSIIAEHRSAVAPRSVSRKPATNNVASEAIVAFAVRPRGVIVKLAPVKAMV